MCARIVSTKNKLTEQSSYSSMTAKYIVWFVADAPSPNPPGRWEKSGRVRVDGAGLVGLGFAICRDTKVNHREGKEGLKSRTRVAGVCVTAEVMPGRRSVKNTRRCRRQ